MRQQAAELAIKEMGITFTVYHEQGGSIDRAWPLDIIPRTISRKEWDRIEAGLKQRVAALNHFIDDVYHDAAHRGSDGVFPRQSSRPSRNYRPKCVGHQSAARVLGAHLRLAIWCATRTAPSTCSRTTCAYRPAFRT